MLLQGTGKTDELNARRKAAACAHSDTHETMKSACILQKYDPPKCLFPKIDLSASVEFRRYASPKV